MRDRVIAIAQAVFLLMGGAIGMVGIEGRKRDWEMSQDNAL